MNLIFKCSLKLVERPEANKGVTRKAVKRFQTWPQLNTEFRSKPSTPIQLRWLFSAA